MKKLLFKIGLVLFLFCLKISSEAQIEKGMKVLTGNISYDYSSWRSDIDPALKFRTSTFSINPQIGFLISDKFCIGISAPFSHYSRADNNGGVPTGDFTSNRITYGIAPYARYYKNIADKFYCFANASIGFGFENTSTKNTSGIVNRGSGYYYSSGLNLGLLYFISPKLAIETTLAGINYEHSQYNGALYTNFNKSTKFSADLMPNGLSLGVSYYFR